MVRVVACGAALVLCGSSVMASLSKPTLAVNDDGRQPYAAVAFDYFALFNPDSVVSAVERAFPGKGRAFTELWRTRQFEYTWLRSMTGRYVDFSSVTEDALVFSAAALHVALTAPQKQELMDAYLHLAPWPDAVDALRTLRRANVRVVALANFSPAMLRANAAHAGMAPLFDALVSTDDNRTYKPDPHAYQLAIDRLRIPKERIVFAAFGGWDAAGAKAFGFPTVWVNRFAQAPEQLGIRPDRTVADLKGLLDFVLQRPGDRSPVE
jgi:2-haloacid dehalogenase